MIPKDKREQEAEEERMAMYWQTAPKNEKDTSASLDKIQEKTNSGAICGDGMCPYVPCKNFPKCGHLEKQLTFEWEQEVISARKELALKDKRIAELEAELKKAKA